jgi:hypothetical protein
MTSTPNNIREFVRSRDSNMLKENGSNVDDIGLDEKDRSNYLDTTDSIDDININLTNKTAANNRISMLNSRKQSLLLTPPKNKKFQMPSSPGRLEIAASEVMALMLLEEIKEGTKSITSMKDDSLLKVACVRGAMRILHTAIISSKENDKRNKELNDDDDDNEDKVILNPIFKENDNNDKETTKKDDNNDNNNNSYNIVNNSVPKEILPFHLLGDREVLANLVAETQAGVTVIENSNLLRQEQEHLKIVILDLEITVEELESNIKERELTIKKLKECSNESRRQTHETLEELDEYAKQLKVNKEEIHRSEADRDLSQRLLMASRQDLKDAMTAIELEQKNLNAARLRGADLKNEISKLEGVLLRTKELSVEEEGKIRNTKSIATDQFRILQNDVDKLQSDFKMKQRHIEDLERYRRTLEEENETRRRDLEGQLINLTHNYDEETRKSVNIQAETRSSKIECEQIVNKKRQLNTELLRINETLATERSKFELEKVDNKRSLELLERKILEADKNVQISKEKQSK